MALSHRLLLTPGSLISLFSFQATSFRSHVRLAGVMQIVDLQVTSFIYYTRDYYSPVVSEKICLTRYYTDIPHIENYVKRYANSALNR